MVSCMNLCVTSPSGAWNTPSAMALFENSLPHFARKYMVEASAITVSGASERPSALSFKRPPVCSLIQRRSASLNASEPISPR